MRFFLGLVVGVLMTIGVAYLSDAAVSGPSSTTAQVEQRPRKLVGVEGYGLSETSPTCSINRSKEERRFLSIGKPVWGVEMKVVDDND